MAVSDTAVVTGVAPRQRGRAWAVYLGIGLAAVLAGSFVPGLGFGVAGLAVIAALVTIPIGIRRHRPTSARPWVLMSIGVACSLLSTVYTIAQGGRPLFPSLADLFDLGLYAFLAAALLTWAKPAPGRSRWEGALDAGVISSAAIVMSWIVVIDPLLKGRNFNSFELAGGLMIPIMDVLLFSVAARTVFFVGIRSGATLLTVLAMGALLTGDSVLFALLARGSTGFDNPVVIAGYSLTMILLGAAALHPSMANTGKYLDGGGSPVSRNRIRMYLLLTSFVPAVTLTTALSNSDTRAVAARVVVPLLAAAAMSMLLLLRLNQLARITHRRATELGERTVELGIALNEQHALQQQLRYQALHDPLTGLGNRALLRDRMEEVLRTNPRVGVHALMLLDLDGFKHVNDTLGHPAGDDLLLQVAERLQQATDGSATLVRLGGDEFAILVADSPGDHVLGMADDILTATRASYHVVGQDLTLTTSIGIRVVTSADSPTDVMRHADLALYVAKGAGKNRIAVYAEPVSTLRS